MRATVVQKNEQRKVLERLGDLRMGALFYALRNSGFRSTVRSLGEVLRRVAVEDVCSVVYYLDYCLRLFQGVWGPAGSRLDELGMAVRWTAPAPSGDWLRRDLQRIVWEARKDVELVRVEVPGVVFSGLDEKLWRGTECGSRYGYLGQKFDKVFSWYRGRIPEKYAVGLDMVMEGAGVRPDEDGFIEYLGRITDLLKERKPEWIHGVGAYLIDIKILCGYDTVKNRADPVGKWFEEMSGLVRKDQSVLLPYIEEAVSELGFEDNGYDTAEEWVRDRGNWAAAGSTDQEAVEVEFEFMGKRGKAKLKGKEVSVIGWSDLQLAEFMCSEGVEVAKVFKKPDEPAKGRVIVNYGFKSYMRVSLLDSFIVKIPDWTPLAKGASYITRMHEQMVQGLRDGFVGVALDFSGWDKSVGPGMVKHAVECIGRKVVSRCDVGKARWVKAVVQKEVEQLDLVVVRGKGDDGELHSMQGIPCLPSGYRWTALLNTIMNRAIWRYIESRLEGEFRTWHMGDDIAVLWKRRFGAMPELEPIEKIAEEVGFGINRHKTVVSRRGVEFLRQWASVDGVSGYPGRLVRGLLWSKPLSDPTMNTWVDKVRELGATLNRAVNWGLVGLGGYMQKRLQAIVPYKFEGMQDGELRYEVSKWLRAPVGAGGLGCLVLSLGGARRAGRVRVMRKGVWAEESVRVPRLVEADKASFSVRATGVEGLLAVRLRQIMLGGKPLPGVRRELRWQSPGIVKSTDFQVSGRVGRVPSPAPSRSDGPGWWYAKLRYDLAVGVDKLRLLGKSWLRAGMPCELGSVLWADERPWEVDVAWDQDLDAAALSRERVQPLLNALGWKGLRDKGFRGKVKSSRAVLGAFLRLGLR